MERRSQAGVCDTATQRGKHVPDSSHCDRSLRAIRLASVQRDAAKAGKAGSEAAAKAKAEADAKAKAEADAKAKADAEAKGKALYAAGEEKYKTAIKTADTFFGTKRYRDAKKYYEEALTYKGGDTYAKDKLVECEKLLNADNSQSVDERQKQLLAKYSPGVTEETISGNGIVIVQRVVVKDNTAWVYQKKIFNWGGISYFRDATSITESIFELETKP